MSIVTGPWSLVPLHTPCGCVCRNTRDLLVNLKLEQASIYIASTVALHMCSENFEVEQIF